MDEAVTPRPIFSCQRTGSVDCAHASIGARQAAAIARRAGMDRKKDACIIAWTPKIVGRGPQAASSLESWWENIRYGGLRRDGPGGTHPVGALPTRVRLTRVRAANPWLGARKPVNSSGRGALPASRSAPAHRIAAPGARNG
ncbi:hypothetical protein GCM10023332_07350 [Luteimonas vadosa]|uniref:Uncharacterized protein n=1 Tax=Luteimonas vadosa TaxID=1165507 RepID=A0ABP9DSY6_9GAMM